MTETNSVMSSPWYLSRTVWATLTTALLNIATAAGYKVDPLWANSLPDLFLNAASLVGVVATIWLHLRSKKAISNAIATSADGAKS